MSNCGGAKARQMWAIGAGTPRTRFSETGESAYGNIDPPERYLLNAKRSSTSETLPSSIIGAGDVASGLRAPKIKDINERSTKNAAKSTADRSFIKNSLSILSTIDVFSTSKFTASPEISIVSLQRREQPTCRLYTVERPRKKLPLLIFSRRFYRTIKHNCALTTQSRRFGLCLILPGSTFALAR